MILKFRLNGHPISLETLPDRRLVDLLREDLGLTGTKEGCGTGECGACTIEVDGTTRLACLMLAAQVHDREVTTIEGLAESSDRLHPVQEALVASGAVQCGFCTSGMAMSLTTYLETGGKPDDTGIREAISGNLCRCTGYQNIVTAGMMASRMRPAPDPPASSPDQEDFHG